MHILKVQKSTSFLNIRSKPSQLLFFAPAARSANESESTLKGPTTTEVAVLSNRERGSGEDFGVVAAIYEHKLRVRLLHHVPKARVGALDDNARSLGNLGLLAYTAAWQDRTD
jgi:hypothetical protein